MSADYPISRISSSEQLRVPLTDKTGDTTGEVTMSVNTGGYGSEPSHLLLLFICEPSKYAGYLLPVVSPVVSP